MRIPEAIFFDFDGVILESANIKTDAFVELFRDKTDELERIRQHHIANMGISRFKKFEWIVENILGRQISEQEQIALGNAFSKIVFDKIMNAPFVPGVQDLLAWSKGKSMLVIASGTPEEELKSIAVGRGISHYFDEICGTPRTKTEIIDQLVLERGLTRSNCLFIGDAQSDFVAARATGLTFIARSTPEFSRYWSENGIIPVADLKSIIADF